MNPESCSMCFVSPHLTMIVYSSVHARYCEMVSAEFVFDLSKRVSSPHRVFFDINLSTRIHTQTARPSGSSLGPTSTSSAEAQSTGTDKSGGTRSIVHMYVLLTLSSSLSPQFLFPNWWYKTNYLYILTPFCRAHTLTLHIYTSKHITQSECRHSRRLIHHFRSSHSPHCRERK